MLILGWIIPLKSMNRWQKMARARRPLCSTIFFDKYGTSVPVLCAIMEKSLYMCQTWTTEVWLWDFLYEDRRNSSVNHKTHSLWAETLWTNSLWDFFTVYIIIMTVWYNTSALVFVLNSSVNNTSDSTFINTTNKALHFIGCCLKLTTIYIQQIKLTLAQSSFHLVCYLLKSWKDRHEF